MPTEQKRKRGRPCKGEFPQRKTEEMEVVELVPSLSYNHAKMSLRDNSEALYSPEVTNSKVSAFMDEILKIRRKSNVNDIESLYECFSDYLNLCSEVGMKVSNLTAYTACGLSKQQIDYWYQGKYHANDPRYKEFAASIKAICAANREQLAMEGKINPVFAIWQQKCHDGFRDNEVVTIVEERERSKTSAEIMKEFSDLD